MVVPGNFPIGCVPVFLTAFQTTNATAYDKHQCLKDLNDFAIFHNQYLQQAISILKKENPNTIILYGDYYNAFLWLLENSSYLGKYKDPCCLISFKADLLIRLQLKYFLELIRNHICGGRLYVSFYHLIFTAIDNNERIIY